MTWIVFGDRLKLGPLPNVGLGLALKPVEVTDDSISPERLGLQRDLSSFLKPEKS
jgi:hypothetical protein